MERRPIVRWKDGESEKIDDEVVTEKPLTLFVNGRELLTLMSLGENSVELAVGFLHSEGFLDRIEKLKSAVENGSVVRVEADIDIATLEKLSEKRTVTTGCGKGTVFHRPLDGLKLRQVRGGALFSPGDILSRMRELEGRSELFQRTGGVHNAALAEPGQIVHMRSDIGRHNAVDMLCGRAFLDGLDVSGLALLVSGRVSSEILRKTAAMGVGLLVSRSAPTTLALDMAAALGVTVVGYARGGRMNIYTGVERIDLGGEPLQSGDFRGD